MNSKMVYDIPTISHLLLYLLIRNWKLPLSKQCILFVLEGKKIYIVVEIDHCLEIFK